MKAITYHGLKVVREGDGWLAEVIVDIYRLRDYSFSQQIHFALMPRFVVQAMNDAPGQRVAASIDDFPKPRFAGFADGFDDAIELRSQQAATILRAAANSGLLNRPAVHAESLFPTGRQVRCRR